MDYETNCPKCGELLQVWDGTLDDKGQPIRFCRRCEMFVDGHIIIAEIDDFLDVIARNITYFSTKEWESVVEAIQLALRGKPIEMRRIGKEHFKWSWFKQDGGDNG